MENQEPNYNNENQSEDHLNWNPKNSDKGASPIASARVMRDVYIQFLAKRLDIDFEKVDLFERGYFFTVLQQVAQMEANEEKQGYHSDGFTKQAIDAMINNTFKEFVKSWAPMPDFEAIVAKK